MHIPLLPTTPEATKSERARNAAMEVEVVADAGGGEEDDESLAYV